MMEEKINITQSQIDPFPPGENKKGGKSYRKHYYLFLLISSTIRLKRYFLLLFISIFFNLFLPVSSFSQSDSLYHYLEIASKNNPAILQKFNEYQAALQKIPQVGSLSDPELTMGVFLSPMELVDGKQVADIRLMQMFPWFGVLRNAKDEMSLMANAKFELFRDAKLQVLYDVQRTWYELYKIKKDISISEKNLEILNIIERLAIVRYKAASSEGSVTSSSRMSETSAQDQNRTGMQSMTSQTAQNQTTINANPSPMESGAGTGTSGLADIYTVQIEKGDLQNNIELLKTRQSTITARFNAFLNRPLPHPVFLNDTIIADSVNLSMIADSIPTNNPMLSMIEFEKQSIEARQKMVKRMGYPMLGVGVNYSLVSKTDIPMGAPEMNGKDMIMPMVAVTLPIYRKKYNAMQNESEFMKNASLQNYQNTSNSLQVEYNEAKELYSDSRRRINLYRNQFVLASKSLNLMMKSFSSSAAGLADVLRVRQQTFDYELKQTEAVADLNTAAAWLRRLGNVGEEKEINGNK
jgi:outer membrane protein TolC